MRESEQKFLEEVIGRILVINLGNLPLFIYKSSKTPGYIASYYIDIQNADKIGDIAAVSHPARTKEEFLKSKLMNVTSWAEKLGLKSGMQVKRAIKILEQYK